MISVDPKAIPDSYRDFLDWMKKEGEFLEIDDEIDWYLEMGPFCAAELRLSHHLQFLTK